MNATKAIKILTGDRFGVVWPRMPEEVEALRLAVEALKRQEEDRFLNVWTFPRPLPGETEEVR